KGFNELSSNLSKLNKDDVIVGFESTAHYHQALFNYLTENQYKTAQWAVMDASLDACGIACENGPAGPGRGGPRER
ncbi:MAG: hypothetical protein IJJ23_09120, partial [Clostridia bacterium]|nr:hypothetical protein [Clostridia bacterium]